MTTGATPGSVRGDTRSRILVLLRRHGHRTAPELAAQLSLSPVGVRRHLTTLERDGLVEATVEKPSRGRPAAVYRLSDAGHETFPRRYDELAHQALEFLGADEGARLREFLAWRNDRLASHLGERVEGATPAERATALADALTEQGYMAEVEDGPDGELRLCQHNCTVEHIATEHPGICASETALFERLLGTAVTREATIVDGAVRCVTSIATAPPASPAPDASTPDWDASTNHWNRSDA
jgi:predicted ArsR family transcriptional regulator